MRIEEVLILDLEASGLGRDSWPIEVGIAWVEAGEVRSWSSLIRPEPDWDPDAWDPVSEEIHGVPMSALQAAPPAWTVAEELLRRIAGRPVYSDAPDFDLKWVRRLLDASPAEAGIRVLDFDMAVTAVCGAVGADWAYERLERSRTPHRAGPDAARMMGAILYGLERSGPGRTGAGSGPTL